MKSLFIILLAFVSCGKQTSQKSSAIKQEVSKYYSAPELNVKVFYEMGAEPYTSDSPAFKYWTLLEKNLQALFTGRSNAPEIIVPKEISQMQALTPSERARWSLEDVVNLSKSANPEPRPSDFEVYFLNGRAAESEGILGFHINGTRIIAIFKEVIRSTGGANPAVPKYVEQATLIHEMGHALGLVNNGVPMQEHHQDVEHGAHCNNSKCVMYWSNEGASGLTTFATEVLIKGDTIMYDDKCLNDTRSYK